ncbi:hypothetical protein AA13595_0981 [Gluconacetobacter johannae DSM 13595]|nr:hypothetical protein [Gluconacetobacter johannae]GBQ82648.1 hypothetical protein AA13595_0981 [Gluconacetobacter johannae DSM 13595]
MLLLSCSAITPVLAGRRHPAPTPAAVPVAAPVQGAPQDNDPTEAGLPKGLPASWKATVLDVPAPHSKAGTGPGTTTNGNAKATAATGPHQAEPSSNRVLIPLPPHMGIAGFQSGDNFIIVVDNAEPMDTSALRGDGIFSTLTVNTLPDATVIQLRLPDTRHLYLSQQAEGWVLADKPPPEGDYNDRRVINPRQGDNGGILYPMRRPGRVLSINDPTSGARLLVGTSASDDGGILSLRNGDGYDVWPTTEGVVVAARSPDIGLKATPDGALLTSSGTSVPDSAAAVYGSDVDLSWLGLRNLSDKALAARFHDAAIAAADSEPAQRFARRLDAARAAFGAGAFVEARGILTVALQDDPEEGARPDVRFLLAASEFLSGGTEGASLLAGPWPDDQARATQVWRGLYLASAGGHDAEAASLLARDFARLKNYPDTVRNTVLPIAAEEIGRYGSPEELSALDRMPAGAPYLLASAFRELRTGKHDRAYAAFRKLVENANPIVSEKAQEQVTSLDLAEGRITPDAAAEQFGSMIPDARLAGREAAVRLLQADAYGRMEKWSDALTAIDRARAASSLVSSEMVAPLLFQTLAEIADAGAKGVDQGNLLHDAAQLRAHLPDLPPGPKKGDILVPYGKMLLALGLPDEAAQAFSDAIPMLDSPVVRALAGEELANADIARNLPKDAVEALARTNDPGLPDDLKANERRILARIALATGDQTASLSLLRGDTNMASLDMSARIHEGKDEWAAAVRDVRRIVEAEIPKKGPLTQEQQALALRLASDATQAGDRSTLDWIAGRVGDRQMEQGNGRVFRLLTKRQEMTSSIISTSLPE